MKKIILAFLISVMVATVAFAAPKWIPRQYYNTDQLIVSGPAIIYDGSIYYKGVTAGDMLQVRNGTSTSGTIIYTFVAPAANGTMPLDMKEKLTVDQGIYFDATLTGGIMGLNIIYQ